MTSVLSINTTHQPTTSSSPPLSSPLSTAHLASFGLDHAPSPTTGILLNKITPDPFSLGLDVPTIAIANAGRRGSIVTELVGSGGSSLGSGGKFGIAAGIANLMAPGSQAVPLAVALPTSPSLTNKRSSLTDSPPQPLSATSLTGRPATSARIRFAPLPIPRRQRALSTGRNIQAKASLSSDGTRRAEWQAKIDSDPPWSRGGVANSDEEAVDEDDYSPEEDNADSKMSWKDVGTWGKAEAYTKLLKPLRAPSFSGAGESFGRRESGDSMIDPSTLSSSFGAPLRKSISTGGMIGSSPFRSALESDRRRSLVGLTTGRKSNKHHRAGSSIDKPDFSSLSASLGRQVEEIDPKSSGSGGARPVKMLNGRVYGGKRGVAPDKPAEPVFNEWNGMMGGASSGGVGSVVTKGAPADDDDDGSGMGWVKRRREQRERERRESELALTREAAQSAAGVSSRPFPTSVAPDATVPPELVVTQPEHQAIAIPTDLSKLHAGGDPTGAPGESSSDEEEEGEDDHDFESDDEDEILEEEQKARTTSSAAGVEVISRHKD